MKQKFFNNYVYKANGDSVFINFLLGYEALTDQLVSEVNAHLELEMEERVTLRPNTLLAEQSTCIGMLFGSCWQMGLQNVEMLLNQALEPAGLIVELRDRNPSFFKRELDKAKAAAKKEDPTLKSIRAKKILNGYKIYHVFTDELKAKRTKKALSTMTHRRKKFINGSFLRLIPELDPATINRNTEQKIRKILHAQYTLNTTIRHARFAGIVVDLDETLTMLDDPKELTFRMAMMDIPQIEEPTTALFHSVGMLKNGETLVTFRSALANEATRMLNDIIPYFRYKYGDKILTAFSDFELEDNEGRRWDPSIGGVVGEDDEEVDDILASIPKSDFAEFSFSEEAAQSLQNSKDAAAQIADQRLDGVDDLSTIASGKGFPYFTPSANNRQAPVQGSNDASNNPEEPSPVSTFFSPKVLQIATGLEPTGGNSGQDA